MRKAILLIVLALVLCVHGTIWAMDDFDDLFWDDLFVELDENEMAAKPEEALLVQDGWDLGGTYRFSVNASRTLARGADPVDNFGANLGGQLYLDARPDPNLRVFAKVGWSYAVSRHTGEGDQAQDPFNLSLQELFSDFNHNNKVFFRAGKQNVKWGVGYFFSPADVISIGRINPLEPEADREGPVAFKIHYPKGSNNYYLYTLFDGVKKPTEVALAPRMEFVLGKTEFGLGGFYQQGRIPRAMLTVSSSLGDLGFFGEAVLSYGSDRGFLEDRGLFYEIVNKDGCFLQATAGGMYSSKDRDGLFNFTGTLQYYFNGEGYSDQEAIQQVRLALSKGQLPPVINPDKLGALGLLNSGRHYLAGAVSWNQILGSKFSVASFLQLNLSDGSGIMTSTLSLPSVSKISPSVGVSFNFGKGGTEFGMFGPNTAVFAAVTLGSGSF